MNSAVTFKKPLTTTESNNSIFSVNSLMCLSPTLLLLLCERGDSGSWSTTSGGQIVVTSICWWPTVELPRGESPSSYHCVLWSGSKTQTQDLPASLYLCGSCLPILFRIGSVVFFNQFSKILAAEVIFPRTQKFRTRKITRSLSFIFLSFTF